MIDVDQTYRLVRFIANENQRKKFNGDEFNMAANLANRERFNELLGPPEKSQDGAEQIAFELTADIAAKLAPFVSDPLDLVVDATGKLSYPSDYVRWTALRRIVTIDNVQHEREVTIVRRSTLGARLDSTVIAPSYEYPIAVPYSNYFQFHPKTGGNAILEHLRLPKEVKWAWTIIGNREVYNALASTHFEWDGTEFNNIVVRILKVWGINIRDVDLLGYAERAKAEGA